MKTIFETVASDSRFSTLLAALKAAGLVETLKSSGAFTLFAPVDAAFGKLPAGTIAGLLKDREKLVAILTNHVVPAKLTSFDLLSRAGRSPLSVYGEKLSIQLLDGAVRVNSAKIISADIAASNGVIHAIDAVLLPTLAIATAR